MDQQSYEKLLDTLLDISRNLQSIPFWKDYAFWSVVLLAITAFFLIRYTRATEKIAKHQSTPAVDVNMVYDKSIKKTYFWFSNASSMPAFVLIKYNINKGEKKGKNKRLRISPYHPRHPQSTKKTATTFLDFFKGDPPDNTKIILNIIITSAFKNKRIKVKFIKSYKFNKSKSRWDETTWGFPDPPFP